MQGAALPHVIVVILTVTFATPCWSYYRCDGGVNHFGPPSSSNNRFAIKISGNPMLYVPGWRYSVSVQSTRQQPVPEKFVGFALHVESAAFSRVTSGVGTFHLYGDSLAKFSERCPHMVMQASNALRSEVHVFWTAPPPGSGCVTFRATVVEQRDLWFMHDGLLSKTICEDIQENMDDLTDVIEDCCACDEAKYEITFEGLWSRQTHPQDFPPNGWMTRFSDVIGASHSADYKIWERGGIASDGLAELVEQGNTKELESELKAESANIRTIIKAKGIAYPNVTGKTFAMFRVDRKHHLMSLLSMIVPSPDWIVGVSRLELCLRNCSWADFKVALLKPWDVGTDSGTTYLSPDTPTDPREPIRRITSQYPADPSNPFYDPSGEEMKPLARLFITRQRLYEKSCADDTISGSPEEEAGECALTEWGEWSSCTATCGRASMTRSRSYLSPEAEERCGGRPGAPELQENAPCELEDCEGEERDEEDENCPQPSWSEWSSCSVTCGTGVKTRTTRKNGWNKDPNCPFVYRTEEVECYKNNCTSEDDAADQGSCNGRIERYYFDRESASCKGFLYRGCKGNENKFISKEECETACSTLIDPTQAKKPTDDFNGIPPGSQVIESDPESPTAESPTGGDGLDCQVSKWSPWSPCSVSCGRGTKTKTRRIVTYAKKGGRCNKKLERTKSCGKRECDDNNAVDPDQPPASGESPEEPDSQQPGPGDCVMGRWTPWSPCSATCGVTSSQMRTRRVLVPPSDEGKACGDRVETRSCNLLPCKT